ncbi:hypothetical protein MJA45_06965 [Paenibacillus aurantius]|uniref:DUF2140 domain-containing protein n=1 Tax=Paenibacillus aurantius TaxID=2918900 RepID=A0AA96LJT3_9BACL|nr:hypothetical protein [Paenibacillus aurantius]WNQ12767.1 hypothetical protein MJA45_06965 [Paenibacillus aurantius]
MKRLLLVLLVLVLAAAGLAAAAVWYVRPAESLDLAYREVDFNSKFKDLIRNRQFAVEITDSELENLLKKRLSENPNLAPGVTVTGARLERDKDIVNIHVNLLYRGKVRAGLVLRYDLSWQSPNLTAVFRGASVRGFTIPEGWLNPGDFKIGVNEQLPSALGVREIVFGDRAVTVWLKLRNPLSSE